MSKTEVRKEFVLPNYRVEHAQQDLNLFSDPLPGSFLGRLEEAAMYHCPDRYGFFAIFARSKDKQRVKQRMYMMPEMAEALECINNTWDNYISQAEFSKRNRRKVNIAWLTNVFLDLDYHKTANWAFFKPEEMVNVILLHCVDSGIPVPTLIIFSGNGLQLKWILSSAIPRQALPRWEAIQKALYTAFQQFGADPKALDASRVLRLVGTLNTRSGLVVRVIYNSKTYWNFEDLCHELFKYTREEVHAFKEKRAIRSKERNTQADKMRGKEGLLKSSPQTLNWDRLEDLRMLAAIRNEKLGIRDGMQDWFLFLATCFAAWSLGFGDLYAEIEELAKEFCPHWTPAEAHSVTSTAYEKAKASFKKETAKYKGKDVDPRYRFSNRYLIETLEITQAEMRQMRTIITTDMSKERDRVRHRRTEDKGMDRQKYLDSQALKKLVTEARINDAIAVFIERGLKSDDLRSCKVPPNEPPMGFGELRSPFCKASWR